MNKSVSLGELAQEIGARLDGDAEIVITGAAPIEAASSGDISFVANKSYARHIETTQASALILDEATERPDGASLHHENPYYAFALALDILYPAEPLVEPGVDETAVVDEDVDIDHSAGVGPLCHVGPGSTIGAGSQLVSSVSLGKGVTIGKDCIIYPGVRILDGCRIGDRVIIHASTVVGSDGFGFAEHKLGIKKVKQIGWVEIEDDVEIGSNCSIDRGALGPTRIGMGTKIDNLVQIAHNVKIGRFSIIVSQVGIAGSTTIGNGVVLAGQVGLVGHINIGDGVKVAAQSGVTKDTEPGKILLGSPARDIILERKIEASLSRLPKLFQRVRALEKLNESD